MMKEIIVVIGLFVMTTLSHPVLEDSLESEEVGRIVIY